MFSATKSKVTSWTLKYFLRTNGDTKVTRRTGTVYGMDGSSLFQRLIQLDLTLAIGIGKRLPPRAAKKSRLDTALSG